MDVGDPAGRRLRDHHPRGRRLPAGPIIRELVRRGWVAMAHLDKLVTSIPGLLAGDAAAGLPGLHHAASPEALWAWVAVAILAWIVALSVAGVWAWHRWGPAQMRGMATVAEAHVLLGEDRLWKVRHVVRPDLFPAGRRVSR